ASGQGLAQQADELRAVVSRKGIGIDRSRLLVFAGAAAAGQCAGSQQQDDACMMNVHDLMNAALDGASLSCGARRIANRPPRQWSYPSMVVLDYSKAAARRLLRLAQPSPREPVPPGPDQASSNGPHHPGK